MTPSPSAGEPALAACPFCGGAVKLREALWPSDGCTDVVIHAAPSECGLVAFDIGTADKGKSVIAAWNRRAAPPATASEQELGTQYREFEDVPSLFRVVLDHFKGKETMTASEQDVRRRARAAVDSWLDEIENFASRRERLRALQRDEIYEWLYAAGEAAAIAALPASGERERVLREAFGIAMTEAQTLSSTSSDLMSAGNQEAAAIIRDKAATAFDIARRISRALASPAAAGDEK